MPWATYTDPEVARVGLSAEGATVQGIDHEVTRHPLDDVDRAITEGRMEGFVKVVSKGDRILGATIVAPNAGEMIGEFVTAIRAGLGLKKILGTIHVYPTYLEANKLAAGAWRRRGGYRAQQGCRSLWRWRFRNHDGYHMQRLGIQRLRIQRLRIQRLGILARISHQWPR